MKRFDRRNADVVSRLAGPVDGTVRPPGSKSLTNRHLLIASLADGRSLLRGASLADDALAMIDGLRQLGVPIDIRSDDASLEIQGVRGFLPAHEADINIGPAGTAMRFLTALCALGHGRFRLDGSPRMRERPIRELVDGLRQIGANIAFERVEGYPPFSVYAAGLSGGPVHFDSPPSSQFLSAMLMVSPYARSDVLIGIRGNLPSQPYVEMTLAAMRTCGVEALSAEGARFIVPAPQRYRAEEIEIEPDASAATYFWSAAAVTGGTVRVRGLSRASLQGDVQFIDVLSAMGCRIDAEADSIAVTGPAHGALKGVDVDLNTMPDTVQTLAVTALFASSPTRIRNVGNLRIKETDRIAALERELTKLGAKVASSVDELEIIPPAAPRSATIDTYDDHRMAMGFALAGLRLDGLTIRNAGCVSKSFPFFFEAMNAID